MEEQAIQRELAWQKIADKLGPLIISDGSLTFGRADYTAENADERAQERTPFYSQKLSYSNIIINMNDDNNNNNNHHNIKSNQSNHSKLNSTQTTYSSHATTNKLVSTTATSNSSNHSSAHKQTKLDKARGRCLTVSGIIIALIILLFTLVILMALGILHR